MRAVRRLRHSVVYALASQCRAVPHLSCCSSTVCMAASTATGPTQLPVQGSFQQERISIFTSAHRPPGGVAR